MIFVQKNKKMTSKKKPIKFCVFTSQRSGSSWLISLLNSHPEIKSFHEIFLDKESVEKTLPQYCNYRNTSPGKRPFVLFRYLELLDSYPGDHESIGFKIMYNQLIHHPELLAGFVKNGYRVIHLVRENHLDRYISNASMEQNGLVHSTEYVKAQPVTIDTSNLLKYLSWQERQVRFARRLLAVLPIPVLEISYQNLIEEKSRTMNEISEFLGIDSNHEHCFSSERRKINVGGYKTKLANYTDTANTLAGTRFEKFLRESPCYKQLPAKSPVQKENERSNREEMEV